MRKKFFHDIRGKHSAGKLTVLKDCSNDDSTRSMKIKISNEANGFVYHPLVRTISETGEKSLFINPVYTVDLVNSNNDSFSDKIDELVRKITLMNICLDYPGIRTSGYLGQ